MPAPKPTNDTREIVGDIQTFTWKEALEESYDIRIDAHWIVHTSANGEHQLQYISAVNPEHWKSLYLGGLRCVYHQGMVYWAIALGHKESLEDAYNRAMSIVGKL